MVLVCVMVWWVALAECASQELGPGRSPKILVNYDIELSDLLKDLSSTLIESLKGGLF